MSLADVLAIHDKAVQDAVLNGTVVTTPGTGTTDPVVTDSATLIGNARTAKEVGGITVDGLAIDTALDTQTFLSAAVVSALLEPDVSCTLATTTGSVTLTAAQVIKVQSALRKYLQACRTREIALLAAVKAGTYTDSMLATGWPSTTITTGAA